MAIKSGCPFCGREPQLTSGTTIESYSHRGKFYALFYCCCGEYLPAVTKSAYADAPELALANAEAAWNTRAA